MLGKVTSCALVGLEGAIVEVEVDISRGLPSFSIVGLPDTAVQESRERVRVAIKSSNLNWPAGGQSARITVNLAPADLRKEGPAYDLPIAVGILIATEQVWPDAADGAMFVGELSLDGGIRHINGILPMAALAREKGYQRLFVPASDAPEAALVQGVQVMPVASLSELAAHLQGLSRIEPYTREFDLQSEETAPYAVDFREIKGQMSVHVKNFLANFLLPESPPLAGTTRLWN